MQYPTSTAETIADGIVHVISIGIGLFGAFWLWQYAPMWQSPSMAWAVGSYIVIMVTAFLVSGLYHMTPISATRLRLRRADHALIFLRIASGYTPLVIVINTDFAYVILAVVWSVALYGFLVKLLFWQGTGGSSIKLYAALSSAFFLLLWPMWNTLDHTAIWLILMGGAIYACGAYVYTRETLPFRYPLWHSLVASSSIIFYLSIVVVIS